jgi:hypothetical protein
VRTRIPRPHDYLSDDRQPRIAKLWLLSPLNNAKRIKARAIDRIGELAEEIPPATGGQPYHSSTGGDVPPSRIQAARDAGLSPDQLKTAIRVHNVPREDFERQVESDNPPTITELARQGTQKRKPSTS